MRVLVVLWLLLPWSVSAYTIQGVDVPDWLNVPQFVQDQGPDYIRAWVSAEEERLRLLGPWCLSQPEPWPRECVNDYIRRPG
jgi:hypothetical protein